MLEGPSAKPPVPPLRPKPPTVPVSAKIAATPVAINRPKVDEAMQREVAAALSSETITIRTMQDDMRAARGEPVRSTPVGETPRSGETVIVRSAAVKSGPAPAASASAPMPLPPKGAPPSKVVMQPPIKRHHRSRIVPIILILLLLALGGSAAAVWWLGLVPGLTPGGGGETLAAATAVLPAQSAVILHYSFTTAEERSAVMSAWNGTVASLAGLLEGDPRYLVAEADIPTFYYVLLEDEMRPYVVVPKTPRTTSLFTETADARVLEEQGWYIINSASTSSYATALSGGSLASINEQAFTAGSAPLQIFLGPHALLSLRESLAGSALANGLLQETSLTGSFSAPTTLQLSGSATALEPLFSATPAAADQTILSRIPAEATLVRLGGAFARDVAAWSATSGAFDEAVLQQASVASWLSQLSGPYALFTMAAPGATRDYGAIITLPPALAAQVRLPDPAIEAALSAVLPLITGRKGIAPIQFSDNVHAGVPLRYANFSQPSQALDYAVVSPTGGSGAYLVISSSRESMFAILETMNATHAAITISPLWQKLLTAWGALPSAPQLMLGSIPLPQLAQFLPTSSTSGEAMPLFGLALSPGSGGVGDAAVTGVVVIPHQ